MLSFHYGTVRLGRSFFTFFCVSLFWLQMKRSLKKTCTSNGAWMTQIICVGSFLNLNVYIWVLDSELNGKIETNTHSHKRSGNIRSGTLYIELHQVHVQVKSVINSKKNIISTQMILKFSLSIEYREIRFLRSRKVNGIFFSSWKCPINCVAKLKTLYRPWTVYALGVHIVTAFKSRLHNSSHTV